MESLRAFPFDFRVQRQSCLLKASPETLASLLPPGHPSLKEIAATTTPPPLLVFCKGSLDAVASLCPKGLPPGCRDVHDKLAAEGAYVLAIGWKYLSLASSSVSSPDGEETLGVSDGGEQQPQQQRIAHTQSLCSSCSAISKVQRLRREDVESDLHFLGLLLLCNELRPDAEETILQLRRGRIRSVMVTGDSVPTAAAVAINCGMVPSLSPSAARQREGGTSRKRGAKDRETAKETEGWAKTPTPIVIGEATHGVPSRVIWTEFKTKQMIQQTEILANPEVRKYLIYILYILLYI